ncbi:hypothetical protein AALP_AA6G213700 [Arabis alpina]|uniref:PB1 domain-containing protein n=1 Tax=Arabis alpina TaxID=50452 RepID=A0A087GQS0_ARAAL|nr:hypothetical protein AALP_AA6G213700 [Arabis alpina]
MASILPPELDNDSLASSPRSEYDNQPRVRFMCTFGGRILPRPPDNQLCYVGGDNRMVAIHRHTTFASLLSKLAKLSGKSNISVKYQLPNEDLDALISVSTDEDVENMMDEYDRIALNQNPRSSRLRLFLFTKNLAGEEDDNDSRASSISSLLDSSVNREQWFLDALNLGSSASATAVSNGRGIERVRSEVSSIVSEVPDYLFGLDTFDESANMTNHELRDRDPRAKIRREVSTLSDPGSPRRDVPSPYGSTSSAPVMRSSTPEFQQTKPDNVEPVSTPKTDPQPEHVIQQTQSLPVNSQWQYAAAPGPQVHYQSPVYYVPGSVQQGGHMVQQGNHMVQPVQQGNHMVQPVQQGNHMVQPVQMPGQYIPQYHHVPMGYHHQPQPHQIPGQVYGGTVRPVMMAVDGVNRAAYYGMKTPGPVQMYQHHPGMVVPGVEEQYRTEPDSDPGRAS